MNWEKSCGAVVYAKENGKIKYLIIQSLEGIYGFPKGHMEGNETERETALREVKEETGLEIELLPAFKTVDSYLIPQKADTRKQVVYFIGYFENQTPVYQKEELSSASLYTCEEAMKLFQFESSKRILSEVNAYLIGRR